MKNKRLIEILQSYDGELEVTTSNNKGVFNDIESVCLQNWVKNNGKHSSITLVINGYDSNKTLVNEDGRFIDAVNKELHDGEKIDKHDALKAKAAFEVDFKNMRKRYQEWFNSKYDKVAKDSMVELFGNDKPLENKTINDLKLYVYENGWQNELDKDKFNDRDYLLHFLFVKLDDKIKENMTNDKDNLWNEVNNCTYKEDKCSSCKKGLTFRDLVCLLDDFNDEPAFENWLYFR